MKTNHILIVTIMSILAPVTVHASDHSSCGDASQMLLTVADFNADGRVTYKDMAMIRLAMYDKKYAAIYDRNADGKLDRGDLYKAWSELGQVSTTTDQQLAKMYQRFRHFQDVSGHGEVMSMNYQTIGGTFAFHGQHWLNTAGQFAVAGLREADPFIAEGINVTSDGQSVPALFWGDGAVPLFNDPSAPDGLSTLDWPSPNGVWNFERVQAFADTPPDFFPSTTDDNWHTHAGLCVTTQDLGNGPEFVTEQHLSNAECQARPNLQKFEFNGQMINQWGNFWMLHAWLFKLNPNGVFGNVHPCVDPDGASEHDINGDRVVPPFFQHHG